jgi:hypothetical protein
MTGWVPVGLEEPDTVDRVRLQHFLRRYRRR